ncbi:MAG: energy-coupling factor transporter transmembrane component T family protein [Gaiellales bacterium]
MKPLGIGLVAGSLVVIAASAAHPLVLAAATLGAASLLAVADGPRRAYVWFAGGAAMIAFLVNPFVAVQGLTPIWQGPHIPLLDTEITQEELAFGTAAAMRILASSLAVAAFVRLADGDLLMRAVARVAPRSAMIASLATRLLPTLERDASGIVLAARTRGATLTGVRHAGAMLPLFVSLSLERSLAIAEAMEARGYGGSGRTRAPARRTSMRERALTALGILMAATAAVRAVAGLAPYRYYDTLDNPFHPAGIVLAVWLLGVSLIATAAVRWRR